MQKLERSLPSILLSLAGSIGFYGLTPLTPATGQIAPDSTQGTENSIVTPNANVRGLPASLIEGGATRGENLFHSFSDFNVGEGLRVYFANSFGIENILTRVTGSNVSNILGTLGVDGTANLFLLNPNGISFGPNARLDIGGSFFASTASSFKFSDGSEFSATNPQPAPLLTVKVTPGVQWGASQPGATITNRGNLAPQQDLTLVADTLDLQGQLVSGRDLTLFATDTVKVRDSAASPFIASAGSQLLVQGNRVVDIFALNHPESGLFSDADMVLRSANTVGGDAHYWSGGSFRIEKLDGDLGNLNSPKDPIIFADGDVSLGDYSGASLHILAGGSVTLGNVEITGTDSTENTINPNNPNPFLASLATVPLSDGTTLTIDGSAKPTLDVRAGIDWTTFLGGAPTVPIVGTVTPLPTFGGATRADITVNGYIWVSQPDGVVLLTNQYRPNGLPGNISTQGIGTSPWDGGNGGSITINSRSNITTDYLESYSESFSGSAGQGGAINLSAVNGSISTGGLDSYSYSESGNASQGGAINLSAVNGSIFTGSLYSDSYSESGNASQGGAINLSAVNGSISTGSLYSYSYSESGSTGNGGAINLSAANGGIFTGNLNSYSDSNWSPSIDWGTSLSTGNGGAINLSATNGSISTGNLNSSSYSQSGIVGDGGAIALTAAGHINTVHVFSRSSLDYDVSSFSSKNGGAIAMTAGGNINTGFVDSSSSNSSAYSPLILSGNAGEIALTAGGNITTSSLSSSSTLGFENFNSFSSSYSGNGGKIALRAGGNISTDDITTSSFSRAAAFYTSNSSGNGGEIALTAGGNISTSTLDSSSSSSSSLSITSSSYSGNGGKIAITAGSGIKTGPVFSYSSSNFSGNGGEIAFTSTNGEITIHPDYPLIDASGASGGNIILTSPAQAFALTNGWINSNASKGDGGNIQIAASSVFLTNTELTTTTVGRGNAGNISLITDGLVSLDFSRLFSSLELGGIGKGGDITIRAGAVSLSNVSWIDTATFGQGNAGGVLIEANDSVSLDSNSSIFSITAGQGNGGKVTVNAGGAVSLANGSNISTAVNSTAQGDGGNIELTARSLSLTGGSQLVTSTASAGKAGDITVNTLEGVIVSGVDPNFTPQTSEVPVTPPRTVDTATAQTQNLNNFLSLDSPDNVNSNVEFSNRIPYVSISRTSFDDTGGSFSFEVTAGTRAIFDIDSLPGSVASGSLSLLKDGQELASNYGAFPSLGAGGSTGNDAYLRYVFTKPGTYTIQVNSYWDGYNLQVSLETPNVARSVDKGVLASGLFARTEGAGTAGTVTINTPQLTVLDGGNISATATAAATSSAQGGSVQVNASQINLSGSNSGLFALTEGAASAGSLTLQPYNNGQTLRVNFQDGAQISASTSSSGQGGSLIVTAPESVTLSGNGQLSVETSGVGQAGDVTLVTETLNIENGARVSATATATATSSAQGGSISANTSQINLSGTGGGLFAETQGVAPAGSLTLQPYNNGQSLRINFQDDTKISASTSSNGQGGSLIVTAPESVILSGNGQLSAETNSTGKAGSATINTRHLTVQDRAQVSASTSGTGQGGNLQVNASDSVLLNNQGSLVTESSGSGAAGDLTIHTRQLTLDNSAKVSTSTQSSQGGDIALQELNTLAVTNNSQISTATQTGQAGSLRVNANSNPAASVQVSDNSRLSAQATQAGGNAGEVSLNTRQLTLENNAQISATNVSGVSEGIRLEGLDTLSVSNSLISASTETGTAGSLSVNATESVDLSGTGGLSVEATEGGIAGDLNVKTGQMSVREGAKVTVSSPSGQAGNLNISANSLSLNRGTLSAETGTSSNEGGANINLSGLDFLLMGNESLISANARGYASGGNITIDSTFIIATPPTGSQGSDIVANAVFGNGGRVSLTTQGLFGIEFRPLRTPKNDITVTSEFGLTGVFQRNSPDVDPSRGLTNLPAEFVDASNQITQNCPARGSRSESSFTITGTGGLPPRPGDAFDSPFPTGTVRSLPSSSTSSNESPSAVAITNPVELNSSTLNRSDTVNSHTSLVEAAGWMYGSNGEVILTAVTPNFTPHGSWSKPPTCD